MAASKTLIVPSTFTRAPSGGSARQNGTWQRGEVDHVRDLVLVERALDRREVGDVARDVPDRGDGLLVQQQPQPARVGREVEGDDAAAVGKQLVDDPGADAAVRARDEEARSAHGASSTFVCSAGRSTRSANASAPSASGEVESQSSGRSPSARMASARANSSRV